MAPRSRSPCRDAQRLGRRVAAVVARAGDRPDPPARRRARVGPADARSLPTGVEAALRRGGIPRDAMVAWVQEVDATRPRLAWQAERPVNPASLMKLVTTFAGLELLGPAFTWSTPVWLQGRSPTACWRATSSIKGSGDPKLVLERIWLLLRRVQQIGVREIRGDIVLDRSAFAPGDARSRRLRRRAAAALQRRRRRAAPQLPRGAAHLHARRRRAASRRSASTRRSPACASTLTVPLAAGPCDDWRGALKADFAEPARMRLAGAYPASCGERLWPVAYADPKSYNERALAGIWREMGGRLDGVVRDGARAGGGAELRAALAEPRRGDPRHQQAQQQRDGAAALPHARRDPARRRHARGGARCACASGCKGRVGEAASGAVIVNGSGLSRESRLDAALLGAAAAGGVVEPGDARADELAAGLRHRRHAAPLEGSRRGAPT